MVKNQFYFTCNWNALNQRHKNSEKLFPISRNWIEWIAAWIAYMYSCKRDWNMCAVSNLLCEHDLLLFWILRHILISNSDTTEYIRLRGECVAITITYYLLCIWFFSCFFFHTKSGVKILKIITFHLVSWIVNQINMKSSA